MFLDKCMLQYILNLFNLLGGFQNSYVQKNGLLQFFEKQLASERALLYKSLSFCLIALFEMMQQIFVYIVFFVLRAHKYFTVTVVYL